MAYFSSRTLSGHEYWLSGSTFRISFVYVDGIPCVNREAGPGRTVFSTEKQCGIIQRFSATILLLLYEPECMNA